MKEMIAVFASKLRESIWVIPLLMLAAALLAAFAALAFDDAGGLKQLTGLELIFRFDAGGSRSVLSAIAGSMITVVGVVFSITVVVLALASNQYGPRLIRNFIRDRINQVAIGTFIATYMYCIVVLGSIDDRDSHAFVPQFAVNLGIALALASLLVLVFYLHHVANSIRPETLLEGVSAELNASIDRYAQQWDTMSAPDISIASIEEDYSCESALVAATTGYIQTITYGSLVEYASAHDAFIELRVRAGHFVIAGARIGSLWSGDDINAKAAQATVAGHIVIGNIATPTQDIEFAVRQLVEIAVRALSPGINDPFTAIACVDYLAAGLARLVAFNTWSVVWAYDASRTPRLRAESFDFDAVLDAALNQLRQYGASNIDVGIAVLDRLLEVVRFTRNDRQRRSLATHARLIGATLLPHCALAHDRDAVKLRLDRFEV